MGPQLQQAIEKRIAEGLPLEEIISRLNKVNATEEEIREARELYNKKKRSSASQSTSAPAPSSSASRQTVSKTNQPPAGQMQRVDPNEISSIRLKPSQDTPAFLQEAERVQKEAITPVIETLKQKPEYNKRMSGSTAQEVIKKINSIEDPSELSSEEMTSLFNSYKEFKSKAGEGIPYNELNQENLPDIATLLEKDSELFSEARMKEIVSRESKGLTGKGAKSILQGGVLMAYELSRELLKQNALDLGFMDAYVSIDKATEETSKSLKVKSIEASRELQSATQALMINSGYTQEQIEKGTLSMAMEGDFGMLGIQLYAQLPNLMLGAVPVVGPAALGLSAGGSAYTEAIQDEEFTEQEALMYGLGNGIAELITEKLFQTDVASIRRVFGGKNIPKNVISESMFSWIPKELRESYGAKFLKGSTENAIEEGIVATTEQILGNVLAGREIDPMQIAESSFIGAAMGGSISAVVNGPSAVLNISKMRTKIELDSKISKINQMLNDDSISESEKDILRQELKSATSERANVKMEAARFYSDFSEEDMQETVKANQSIKSAYEAYNNSSIQEVKQGALNQIKDAVAAKREIENKYSQKRKDAPKAFMSSIEGGSIQQSVDALESRMANAEDIDIQEIESTAEQLMKAYEAADKDKTLRPREKEAIKDAIETKINELLDYELATTTRTKESTETATARSVVPAPKEGVPQTISQERFEGQEVDVDGKTGTIKRDGELYNISFQDGTEVKINFGRIEYVSSSLDASGNLSVQLRNATDGTTFTIKDNDLALDLAISESQKQIGVVPEGTFQQVIRQVTKKTSTQETVYVNEGKARTENPLKGRRKKSYNVTEDNASDVLDELSEQLDDIPEEDFKAVRTTRNRAKTGLASIESIISSLSKSGKKATLVVHTTDKSFMDAVGEKEVARGMHVVSEDGNNEIHLYLPAMIENTAYHEAMHELLPSVFGESSINRLANRLITEIRKDPFLSKKFNDFLEEYEDRGESVQSDELITEMASMIASGDVEIKIQESLISKFVKSMLDLFGFKVKPNVTQMVDALDFMANRLAEGAEIDLESIRNKYKTDRAMGHTVGSKAQAPAGNRLFNNPLSDAKKIADEYFQSAFGLSRPVFDGIRSIDAERAKKIAKAYEEMKDDYSDPDVKAAYDAMVKETIDQYEFMVNSGYTVEINNEEPYSSAQDMIEDLRSRKVMKIFSTESGFGDSPITQEMRKNNPLLRDSGFKDSTGIPLLVNDVFRAVHDFFGHSELGNGFGAVGEENAWNVHARMYSPLARKAMTSETRGQNSYVNFSGVNDEAFKLRDQARELRKAGKTKEADELVSRVYDMMKFADQKVGILPAFAYQLDSETTALAVKKYSDISEDGSPSNPIVKNPSRLISKAQLIGNSSVKIEVVHTEENRLKKYEEDGVVSYKNDLSFLNGRKVITLSPDDMLAGEIKINGKTVHEAGGGVFFVLKYRDIWAFSDSSTANVVKNQINSMVDRNGATHLLLVKGSDAKLMSSPQGAKSALLMLETLAEAGLITEQDMAKAFQDAVAKNGGIFSVPENTVSIKRAIESYFEDPTQSTFAARGKVVKDFIVEIGNTESGASNAKGIQKFFGSDGLRKPSFSLNAKDTDGTESMINLVARASSESITKGLNSGDVYAVIPIHSRVEVFKSDHPSYPFHLRFEDKNTKPNLVILSERSAGRGVMKSLGGDGYKNMLKSFDGSVLGLVSKGWGRGIVDVPTKNTVSKAQLISSDTSSNYANLTEDGNGNFVFYHFSDQNFDAPDPSMAGKNKRNITSREEKAALSTAGPVTMFYTDINDREGLVSSEFGYEVRVPMDRVYDLDADPMNLEEEARNRFKEENPDLAFGPSHRAFAMTAVAAEKGFDMTVGRWVRGLSRAHSAIKLPVTDRMIARGKNKKQFNEEFKSNKEKGWSGVSPSDFMGSVYDAYTKISWERGDKGQYDDIYRLYYEYGNYSQEEITGMINSSDLSAESKKLYNDAIAAVPSGHKSVQKKAQAMGKKAQAPVKESRTVELARMATKNKNGTFDLPMTEDDYVYSMIGIMSESDARSVYKSVKRGKAFVDRVEAAKKSLDILQKKLKAEEKSKLEKLLIGFIDSQRDLKHLLLKAKMNDAYSLLVTRAGHGDIAKYFASRYEKDVYHGLSKEEIQVLNKIIFARRVVQVDTNADAQGKARPKHPSGPKGKTLTKESAEMSLLTIENAIGTEAYNKLNERADRYFNAFRVMLYRAYENDLITKESYDMFVNFDYQPRRFFEHVVDFDEHMPNDFKSGINANVIKAIKNGSFDPAIMDSRYLLVVYTKSLEARIANNKVRKAIADAAIDDKNKEWAMVTKSPSSIPTQFQEVPKGWSLVTFFDKGVQDAFLLREDLLPQISNAGRVELMSSKRHYYVSWFSGSKILKTIATATNPLFVLSNLPRDFFHVLLFTDKYDGMDLFSASVKLVIDASKGGYAKVFKTPLYEDWIMHGGGMDFLSTQGNEGIMSIAGQKVANTLSYLGETSEAAFRLAVYQRTLSKMAKENGGKVTEEMKVHAAAQSREIIDFSQGGTITKEAESIMPYVNAAFQGFRVATNYIKDNPVMFGAKLAQASVGILGLAMLNLAIGDEDEFEKIPDYVKQNYFVILTPIKDKEGNRKYIKVAKTQQARVFMTPIENFMYGAASSIMGKEMGKNYNQNYDDVGDALVSISETYLPIDILDPQRFAASINPLLGAMLTYGSNYDSFRKQIITREMDIVDARLEGIEDKSIPVFYKVLGEATARMSGGEGISPARTKAAIEKVITSPSSSLTVGVAYSLLDMAVRPFDVESSGAIVNSKINETSNPVAIGLWKNIEKKAVGTIDDKYQAINIKEDLMKADKAAGSQRKQIDMAVKKIGKSLIESGYSASERKKAEAEFKSLVEGIGSEAPTDMKYAISRMKAVLTKKNYPAVYDDIRWSESDQARAKKIMIIGGKMNKNELIDFYKKVAEESGYKIPTGTIYEYKRLAGIE